VSIAIRVGGRWMDEIAPWAPPKWSSTADGGCADASWRLYAPATFRHPALRRGQLVEIRLGAMNAWKGVLSEPTYNEDGWEVAASGLSSDAGDGSSGFLALNGAGDPTTYIDDAIDRAIDRGLRWQRPDSLQAGPFGDGSTDEVSYLADLLDRWSDSVSKRWGVDADGNVYATADPTVPMWHMTPGSGTFGLADDEFATDIYLRYYDPSLTPGLAHAGDTVAALAYHRKEELVDGRDYGAITTIQADGFTQGFLDKGAARLGWTNTVEPTRYQLTTPGGAPASLPLVRGQQMVRLHGITDEQGQPLAYVDFVIGTAEYDATTDSLSLAPVGMAPRSLADILTLTIAE
jgi:hypothetical protein